jgi:ketosteroid isomerase-like protein
VNDEAAIAEVRAAADVLVSAFGAHRTEEYFGAFHPDATFVFHTSPMRLDSREQYREEWARWEREDGFRVLECLASGQMIQRFGDVAILTHSLATRVALSSGEETVRERETIVFQRQPGGDWLAVHEHLSPDPDPGADDGEPSA